MAVLLGAGLFVAWVAWMARSRPETPDLNPNFPAGTTTASHPRVRARTASEPSAPGNDQAAGHRRLTVEVKTSDGTALGAQVHATSAEGTTSKYVPAAAGAVELWVPAGRIEWRAYAASPEGTASPFYEGATLVTEAIPDGRVVLTLAKSVARVIVAVVDEAEAPVAGVRVELGVAGSMQQTRTDLAGRTAFEGVRRGADVSDVLSVESPVGMRLANVTDARWSGDEAIVRVVLGGGPHSFSAPFRDYRDGPIVVQMRRGEKWVEAQDVHLQIADRAGPTARVDASGTYTLSGTRMAPGTYRICYVSARSDALYVAEFTLEGASACVDATFVAVQLETYPGRLDGPGRGVLDRVQVEPRYAEQDNAPFAGKRLPIAVEADGTFRLPLLPGANAFDIEGCARNSQAMLVPRRAPRRTGDGELRVDTLVPARLRGRVVDRGGRPIRDAAVYVWARPEKTSPPAGNWLHYLPDVRTDASGDFATDYDVPGSWVVIARRPDDAARPSVTDPGGTEVRAAAGTVADAGTIVLD